MKQIAIPVVVLVAGILGPASWALAAGSGLPGDAGRLGNGIPVVNAPLNPVAPLTSVPRPTVELAMEAAQAISTGCKQYNLGVAVVDAGGRLILTYIPDRSNPEHAFLALRKAYSAVTLKATTAEITAKSQTDKDYAAKVTADPNLMTHPGGVLLKAGDKIVGAIGVSGANDDTGRYDDECAQLGLAKIKSRLK